MSEQELAKNLIDRIPETHLRYVIAYLRSLPEETPNAATLSAFAELDGGGGHRFSGSTERLFSELMESSHAAVPAPTRICSARKPERM